MYIVSNCPDQKKTNSQISNAWYVLAKPALEYYISPTKPMLWFKAVKKSSNRTLMRNMEICRKLQTAVCAVLNYILYSLAAAAARCHRAAARRPARLCRQICNWHTNWDKSVQNRTPRYIIMIIYFLHFAVRLGSKHNVRASILASSLCLDSASLRGGSIKSVSYAGSVIAHSLSGRRSLSEGRRPVSGGGPPSLVIHRFLQYPMFFVDILR